MKLKKSFYSRDTTQVAQELIGKILCRKLQNGTVLKAMITEVEAYLGINDMACHTYKGRRTARTEVMWGDAGRAYVYFIYGKYFCLNAVTQKIDVPEAVLIRAAIPLDTPLQKKVWHKIENNSEKLSRIMSGPGRLCKVLKINKTFNCLSLSGRVLWIESGLEVPTKEIVKSPRVGIDYTLDDPEGSHQWPLRFLWKPVISNATDTIKENSNESIYRYYKNNWKNTTRKNAKNRERSSGRNST